jgi:DNA (cytosine-5)-methyltransferase 1
MPFDAAPIAPTKTPRLAKAAKPKARRTKKAMRKVLVADLFCGAGGSSTGARRALRKRGIDMILTCVNHWPVAIETHRQNHPEARHYCQDVNSLRPSVAVPEGHLDLMMASPSCVHFSSARGGRPTSDQQRMDPYTILTWLTELRVDRLLVENVPEFLSWGPVDPLTGKPIKERKGEYFRAWVAAIEGLGFVVDWRVLNAADYGDATTRRRFFLMARSDGKPIVWPEPTHAKEPTGKLKRWRPARDIIDWDQPGASIFTRKRPLAPKTIARIMAGAKKFGWPEAFLVVLSRHLDAMNVDGPLPTITANGTHIALAETRAEPLLLDWHGENGVTRCSKRGDPMPTAACGGTDCPVESEAKPFVLGQQGGAVARDTEEPLPTIATAGFIRLFEPDLTPCLVAVNHGDKANGVPSQAPRSLEDSLPAVTAKRGTAVIEPQVQPMPVHMKGRSDAAAIAAPASSITTEARPALAEGGVIPIRPNGGGRANGDSLARVEAGPDAFLVPQFGERPNQTPRTHGLDAPLPTVTSHGAGALVEPEMSAFVVNQHHDKPGAEPRPRSGEQPLPTNTAGGGQEAIVESILRQADNDDSLRLALEQGRVAIINGQPFVLDIRFRMLSNAELARAMGFEDEESSYEFVGTQTDVTRQIGNAVPVNCAAALVDAIMSR